jgi:hypothetical protein
MIDFLLYFAAIIFIIPAFLKCLSLKAFVLYLESHSQYSKFHKLFPHLIAFEITIGSALVLKISPFVFLLIAIVFILILTVLKLKDWFVNNNNTCNCYSPLIAMPMKLSVSLNFVYLFVLSFLFLIIDLNDSWTGQSAGLVLFFIYFCSFVLVLFLYKQPELQINFIKKDTEWKNEWLKDGEGQINCLYIFLNQDCDKCDAWLHNLRHWKTETHGIVKLVVKKNQWSKEKQLNLGVSNIDTIEISPLRFSLLVDVMPLAIDVRGSKVIERYEDNINAFKYVQTDE